MKTISKILIIAIIMIASITVSLAQTSRRDSSMILKYKPRTDSIVNQLKNWGYTEISKNWGYDDQYSWKAIDPSGKKLSVFQFYVKNVSYYKDSISITVAYECGCCEKLEFPYAETTWLLEMQGVKRDIVPMHAHTIVLAKNGIRRFSTYDLQGKETFCQVF